MASEPASLHFGKSHYRRHQPELTVLFAIISNHYPHFIAEIERRGDNLPCFVQREFEDYLKSGLLEHWFLRVKCDPCRHEHLVAFSCKRILSQLRVPAPARLL